MKPNRSTCFLSQERFDQIKSKYANFNAPWQGTEVKELKAMFADQISIEDIANQLQRTPNSIKLKLKALGLFPSSPNQELSPAPAPASDEPYPSDDYASAIVPKSEMPINPEPVQQQENGTGSSIDPQHEVAPPRFDKNQNINLAGLTRGRNS